MITRTSVRVAFASTLIAAALTGLTVAAAPAVANPVQAPAAQHVVVFDDNQIRGLDRCVVLEADNTTRCTVLPTEVLNRLVAEYDLDRAAAGPSPAEGLSAALSDPRWR